jgi:hypothetical protein
MRAIAVGESAGPSVNRPGTPPRGGAATSIGRFPGRLQVRHSEGGDFLKGGWGCAGGGGGDGEERTAGAAREASLKDGLCSEGGIRHPPSGDSRPAPLEDSQFDSSRLRSHHVVTDVIFDAFADRPGQQHGNGISNVPCGML